MKTKITQNIKATVLGLIIALGVGYASAWTGAPANPPNSNVSAPINVGSIGQTKFGSLTVGGLGILGDFTFVPKVGAVITDGQVLVADGTTGKVKWGTVSGSGGGDSNINITDGGGVTKVTAGTGISVTPASGVGTVMVGLSGTKKPVYLCPVNGPYVNKAGNGIGDPMSCTGALSTNSTCTSSSPTGLRLTFPCVLAGYIVN